MPPSKLLGDNILLLQQNMSNKEDFINEAIRGAATLNLAVISRTTTTPPTINSLEDLYIVPANAIGQWLNQTNKIAYPKIAQVGSQLWGFYAPYEGLTLWSIEDAQLIVFSDNSWQTVIGIGGGGDMNKADYDPNNTGNKVAISELAESVDWDNVFDKPVSFTPSAHNHDAANITAGVFNEARIPTSFDTTRNANLKPLTDGATINWNLASNQVAQVTLGGNRTLANPTNMVAGATYILFVRQDGTGNRTLTFGNQYKFGSANTTLSTGANAVDIFSFVSDGSFMYGTVLKGFL